MNTIENITPLLIEAPQEMIEKDIPMEEINLDNDVAFMVIDKPTKLLKNKIIDEHGEAHFGMDALQKIARKNVFAMLKLPIILGCFCIATITCIIQGESFLTIIATLGIILTCFEYRYELKNFKRIHKNALTCWTSSLVWKKSNRDELPEYHQYNPTIFKGRKGLAHPTPTQLEITEINEEFTINPALLQLEMAKNKINEEFNKKIDSLVLQEECPTTIEVEQVCQIINERNKAFRLAELDIMSTENSFVE